MSHTVDVPRKIWINLCLFIIDICSLTLVNTIFDVVAIALVVSAVDADTDETIAAAVVVDDDSDDGNDEYAAAAAAADDDDDDDDGCVMKMLLPRIMMVKVRVFSLNQTIFLHVKKECVRPSNRAIALVGIRSSPASFGSLSASKL